MIWVTVNAREELSLQERVHEERSAEETVSAGTVKSVLVGEASPCPNVAS